ncbi:uncharacterized protein P174DRAFT_223692 [Aspergillus novofumigatus IBT 16806]|uniref:Uncharacterized protein n=1 Tax=Aspergillus novofumigatus (strain IBT 16806) TaxID=1392255 RepID=A0A2I1C6B9_ASPN1|nr:uncharacterized protein P174DRAFT_223692 [Aspergillus novofumigatus IBT 16806]PKX93182.1 hypothetical protein P174DRAFT_223692 [Aspergillus novofumigatus IBT 16806]
MDGPKMSMGISNIRRVDFYGDYICGDLWSPKGGFRPSCPDDVSAAINTDPILIGLTTMADATIVKGSRSFIGRETGRAESLSLWLLVILLDAGFGLADLATSKCPAF